MKQKINTLETLRGIAALLVAIYHFPSTSFLYWKHGLYAVYFFFVLSGFIISYVYFSKINNFKELYSFQKKRFFRVYPVHLLMLLIVLLIQICKYIVIKYTALPYGGEAFGDWYTTKDFILNLFLLQSIFDYGYWLSWNGSSWSISTEFYTYLIFGLILLFSRSSKKLFVLILLGYLFSYFIFYEYLDSLFNVRFLQCIFSFFCGALTFLIYSKILKNYRLNDAYFTIILIGIILHIKFNFILRDVVDLNLIFSILILSFVMLKKTAFIYKLLNYKYFILLGTVSYSYYMIHHSVLYLYVQFLKFVVNVNFVSGADGVVSHTGNNFYDSLITISYLILTFFISLLVFRFIEKRFRITTG